jgi:hypothetical protein
VRYNTQKLWLKNSRQTQDKRHIQELNLSCISKLWWCGKKKAKDEKINILKPTGLQRHNLSFCHNVLLNVFLEVFW